MVKNEEKFASEEFDSWAKKGFASSMEAGHFPVAKQAINKISIDKKHTLLDLSCGNGWAGKYFLSKGIFGAIETDISFEMLKKAEANLSDFTNKISVQSSVNYLPFKNDSFDIIFNMESFYYYKNPEKVLKEIFRIMKNKGIFLLLVDYYKESKISMRWSKRLNIYMNPLSIMEYKTILEKTGFKTIEIERIKSPNIREEENFEPSDSIKTYDEYLEFKQAGTLSITAIK
jgi:ubiquinone/menaquinone biosynthesis C-methylase UbiE